MSRWTTTAAKRIRIRILPSGSNPNPLRLATPFSSAPDQMGDILLVAYLTKTLSQSGTRDLDRDRDRIRLTESLVLRVLRRWSINPLRKLEFFRWCSVGNSYKHSAGVCSQLVRALCRAGFLEEVVGLVKEDGVVPDADTFKVLLDAFIRSGRFDLAPEILHHMEEFEVGVDPRMYESVMVALVRNGQFEQAMSILFRLLEGFGSNGTDNSGVGVYLPGSIASNTLLAALRKEGMRVEFKTVFNKLRGTKELEFDTWGYNICIHAFGCWGELDTSFKLFKEMKEKGLSSRFPGPDLCTYNSLIHVMCLAGKVKDALTVYKELKDSGHEPDAFTYRILVQWCCKSYRINDAISTFGEMEHNGYIPDTVVYNSRLDGMLKARKVVDACQLFEKMVEDRVRASCWTYNILIDGLFRNGRAEAGYTLFCDLKKKGQFVDAVTYRIVVLQLCKEGLLEEALHLVKEMQDRGFVVDLVTITSLLIGFHKQGRWDSVERLMKHIRDSNLVAAILEWKAGMDASLKRQQSRAKDYTSMFPDKGGLSQVMGLVPSSDLGSAISGYHGSEDPEDQSAEIDQWSSSPYMDRLARQASSAVQSSRLFILARDVRVRDKGRESFDIDMVNTYLSIFLSKGKLSLACKLFEIFSEAGINPVNYSYNAIMSSFVKKGYFDKAWDVLGEMGEKVCPADIATYNVIIQGLGKMGRADLAGSVLDKLMKQGGYLDVVMYNTLINVLGKAGRIDEANKLFEQMQSSGINPDVVSYNTLIEVHSKAGRLKDAYKFLKMMLDAGCLPNHVTDTTLDFLAKEIDKQRYEKASIARNKLEPTPSPTDFP